MDWPLYPAYQPHIVLPSLLLALSCLVACTLEDLEEPPLGVLTLTPIKGEWTVSESDNPPGIVVAVSYSAAGFDPLRCTVSVSLDNGPFDLAETYARQTDRIEVRWPGYLNRCPATGRLTILLEFMANGRSVEARTSVNVFSDP